MGLGRYGLLRVGDPGCFEDPGAGGLRVKDRVRLELERIVADQESVGPMTPDRAPGEERLYDIFCIFSCMVSHNYLHVKRSCGGRDRLT